MGDRATESASTVASDWLLVRQALAGAPGAFDLLHSRTRVAVYHYLASRLRDSSEAEELTQEVYLQAFRSLAGYEGRSPVQSWLLGIAHYQLLRRYRRHVVQTVTLDDYLADRLAASATDPERRAEASLALARCWRVLEEEVPSGQRAIFDLRYCANQATRAIAEKLGKSDEAVKVGLHRARKTLARRVPAVGAILDPR